MDKTKTSFKCLSKRIWVSYHGQTPITGPRPLVQVLHGYGHKPRVRQLLLAIVVYSHAIIVVVVVIVIPVIFCIPTVVILLLVIVILVRFDVETTGIATRHRSQVRVRAAPDQHTVVAAVPPVVTAFVHTADCCRMPHRINGSQRTDLGEQNQL